MRIRRYLHSAISFALTALNLQFRQEVGMIDVDPTHLLEFFAEETKLKYVPPLADIERVIAVADVDTQDYLITIKETMARVSEVNRLTWDDVNLLEN